jgi:hypothetical protein
METETMLRSPRRRVGGTELDGARVGFEQRYSPFRDPAVAHDPQGHKVVTTG